jgi:uncharacterized membrane protein YjjP (DUF1212 family)
VETELQEIETRDEQLDNRAQRRALLAFGVPVLIAGVLLLVRGIQDWGAPAIVAGFVLGALGLSIAVIAISVSGTRERP